MNYVLFMYISTKGQLISKCLFGIFNSPKKRTNKFDFTTLVPQVELFSFIFWENWKTPKRHFEINWHLLLTFSKLQLEYKTLKDDAAVWILTFLIFLWENRVTRQNFAARKRSDLSISKTKQRRDLTSF